MEQIISIAISFFAGFVLRHFKVFDESNARAFNRFVIYISLPAIVLLKIHGLNFQSNLLIPVSMPWINFALSFMFFVGLGKFMKWSSQTTGALVMMGGLGNTSFVGFPMVEAFYGKENLPTAILLDQLGSFLILALVGVPTAAYFGGGERQSLGVLLRRVVSFPPFIALVLAFILIPTNYPQWATSVLSGLGQTLLPIALLSVGIQTKFSGRDFQKAKISLTLGLLFKLFIAPALLVLIYFTIFGSHELSTKITIFLSAMAPMITAGIVSTESGLDRELVNLMLGVGIPLSLLTSTLWYYLLE